jgi:peptidoglycan-N-acetylglucosamine deacetylase
VVEPRAIVRKCYVLIIAAVSTFVPLFFPSTATAQAPIPRGDSYIAGGKTAEMQQLEATSAYAITKCGNTTSRVLLSYDDWSYSSPPRMVSQAKLLKSKDVGALFFPIRQPHIDYLNKTGTNLVIQSLQQSQYMGNHTWSHPNLTTLSSSGIDSQIARGVGQRSGSSGYMRPPYGAYNTTVKSIAEGMNYHICTWTVDTEDWNNKTASQICSHVKANVRAGSVVLMHLQTKAYDATNCIIDGIRAKGLSLCRPYKVNGQYARTPVRAPYPLPC